MDFEAFKAEMQQNQQIQVEQNFGRTAFIPSNRQDRNPKHDKLAIKSYEEYRAYLKKIGLQDKVVAQRKKTDAYDELFERYNIPKADRHYIFLSDLKEMDQKSKEYKVAKIRYDKLVKQIPELQLEVSKPTMSDALKEKLNDHFFQDELNRAKVDAFNLQLFEKNKEKHR